MERRVPLGPCVVAHVRGSMERSLVPPPLRQAHQFMFSSTNQERVVVWAIACTAFFGFFRHGDMLPEAPRSFNPATDLAWGDVAADSHVAPRMLQIHLKKSKCDQFGRGSDIVLGRTDSLLYPVAALLHYIAARGARPGPFFLNTAKRVITKPWFVGQFRDILRNIGLPQHQYAGHSFRIGAATTAALAEVEDSMIQTLGRWHSAAFLQYIRTPKEHLAAIAAVMGPHGPGPPALVASGSHNWCLTHRHWTITVGSHTGFLLYTCMCLSFHAGLYFTHTFILSE